MYIASRWRIVMKLSVSALRLLLSLQVLIPFQIWISILLRIILLQCHPTIMRFHIVCIITRDFLDFAKINSCLVLIIHFFSLACIYWSFLNLRNINWSIELLCLIKWFILIVCWWINNSHFAPNILDCFETFS